LVSIVEAIIIFLVLTREDARGLHDLLFNTKVVSIEEINSNKFIEKTDKKVIDTDYKEEDSIDGKETTKKTRRRKK